MSFLKLLIMDLILEIHIIFDNYGYEYSVPRKQRNVSRMKNASPV